MGEFVYELVGIIQAGGSLMLALVALAFALYWLGIDTLSKLPRLSVAGKESFIKLVVESGVEEFKASHLQFFHGRKHLLRVLTTIAPLLGLLGTVTGMLATFRGLTQNEGNVFDQVAAGISEAMITTETGLIISIPALLLLMFVDFRIEGIEQELLKLDRARG